MSDLPHSGANRVVKLFGALLMAVGGLIAVLSGLCSLAYAGAVVLNTIQHPDWNTQGAAMLTMVLPLMLIFGGIPIAVGVGLFVLGRSLYRRR